MFGQEEEKPREVACNNFAGARQLGRSGPNGVNARSILPDRPHLGKGPSMSANITPAAAKSIDPTEAKAARGDRPSRRLPGSPNRTAIGSSHPRPGKPCVPGVPFNPPPFVPKCTCKDYANREQDCKHVFAVRGVHRPSQRPCRRGHPDRLGSRPKDRSRSGGRGQEVGRPTSDVQTELASSYKEASWDPTRRTDSRSCLPSLCCRVSQ